VTSKAERERNNPERLAREGLLVSTQTFADAVDSPSDEKHEQSPDGFIPSTWRKKQPQGAEGLEGSPNREALGINSFVPRPASGLGTL
jgi:hypothetical protein